MQSFHVDVEMTKNMSNMYSSQIAKVYVLHYSDVCFYKFNYFLMQKYEDVLYASNSAFVTLSALL